MSLRRAWAITRKEISHILRDRTTFFLVALGPTVLLLILAYAVTSEIRHVPLAALDLDRSPASRGFLQQITVGEDLDLVAQVDSMGILEELLLREAVDVAVVIPHGFQRDLLSLRGMPLQVVVDGTEPQTGGFAVDHIARRAEVFALDLVSDQLAVAGIDADALQPIDLRVRNWYNPSLKARVDIVPGLLSMLLGIPGISVALTLARERELGTLEQLLATPIGRAELLLGKMGPYVIAGLANVVLTTAVAMVWFRVPFHGNFLLYLLLSSIYFFALLSLGMIVGVFIRTQAAALALSFLVIFFPGFFLTGIFFPIASMPEIVRMEALSMPGTHYAIITRGSFITGVGMEVLWPHAVALAAMGALLSGVGTFFFRKKLA